MLGTLALDAKPSDQGLKDEYFIAIIRQIFCQEKIAPSFNRSNLMRARATLSI